MYGVRDSMQPTGCVHVIQPVHTAYGLCIRYTGCVQGAQAVHMVYWLHTEYTGYLTV